MVPALGSELGSTVEPRVEQAAPVTGCLRRSSRHDIARGISWVARCHFRYRRAGGTIVHFEHYFERRMRARLPGQGCGRHRRRLCGRFGRYEKNQKLGVSSSVAYLPPDLQRHVLLLTLCSL